MSAASESQREDGVLRSDIPSATMAAERAFQGADWAGRKTRLVLEAVVAVAGVAQRGLVEESRLLEERAEQAGGSYVWLVSSLDPQNGEEAEQALLHLVAVTEELAGAAAGLEQLARRLEPLLDGAGAASAAVRPVTDRARAALRSAFASLEAAQATGHTAPGVASALAALGRGLTRLLTADPGGRTARATLNWADEVRRRAEEIRSQADALMTGKAAENPDDLVGEAAVLALQHLHEYVDVDAMAVHTGLSRHVFEQRFTALADVTPLHWLLLQRIRRARRILEAPRDTGDRPVPLDAIAAYCGLRTSAALRELFGSGAPYDAHGPGEAICPPLLPPVGAGSFWQRRPYTPQGFGDESSARQDDLDLDALRPPTALTGGRLPMPELPRSDDFQEPEYIDYRAPGPQNTGQFERPPADGGRDDAHFDAFRPPEPPPPPLMQQREPEALPPTTDPGDGPPYDTVESDWFRGHGAGGQDSGSQEPPQADPVLPQPPVAPHRPPSSWRGSSDDELGHQAERVRRQPPQDRSINTSGLPRRVPRAGLVGQQTDPQLARAPEDLRDWMANFRRGVLRGRNAGTGANDPELGQARGSTRRDAPARHEVSERPGVSRPGLPWTAPASVADELLEPRHLVAELAEQAAPDREVPLHVQITREPGEGGGSALMRPMRLPPKGARVTITVHAPGLRVLGDLQQQLTVYPGHDSGVLYFGLRTTVAGLHRVTVRAFRGGTCLGEVRCQISVAEGGVTRDGPRRFGLLPDMGAERGEVTLQVHRNAQDGSFSFQLLSETCYAPEQFRFHGGDPRHAAERIYAELRDAARRAGPGVSSSAADTARLRSRLKNQGVQLWTSAVPEAVQRQFWEQADRVTSITVLGEHDFVPWELLYPLDPHHDNGFLAEWLPVVRRVFGQDRVDRLTLPGAAFVVPPGSPPDADLEIAALRECLGPSVADGGVFTESIALTALIERGHAGLLHFACHNTFSGSGSRVSMSDGSFDPIDLATAAQTRSLLSHHPLVFFNACRSAGEIDWFGSTLGWASQFLHAGAGAFIGTLWPVRSDSAMLFAKAFYDQLLGAGRSLGQSSLAARQAIRDHLDGDPTWLAYAVYGSPAATATIRAPLAGDPP
ncbi:CHAT domain-containing protein [Streptomyces niveus]|uniref:CHAT domain-containing protein n=1 Tax=Streptomyces niveus TaxID=193462 RepID=UPI0036BCE3FA